MTPSFSQEGGRAGEEWTLDASGYALSVQVAEHTHAVPRFCYANAWHALCELPALFAPDGSLVEGWIVLEWPDQVAVIEHAWCETALGQLLDPSIAFLADQDQPVYFFPGLRHSWTQAYHLPCEQLPVARSEALGEEEFGLPAYQTAYEAAYQKAVALASDRRPAKPVVVHPCRPAPQWHLVCKIVSSTHFLKGARDATEL